MSFNEVKKRTKVVCEREKRESAHDFSHTERVMKNAEHIGKKEKANMKIIRYAALLHDYVREAKHELKGNHALASSKTVRRFLLKELPKDEVDQICHAIEAHSRSSGVNPKTIEAMVVYDADKMDLSGPIGVMRWICQGQELDWSIEKSLKLYVKKAEAGMKKGSWAYTKTGKKLIQKRMMESIALCKETLEQMNI